MMSDPGAEKKCRRGSSTSSRVSSLIDSRRRKFGFELDTHAKDDARSGQVGGDGVIKWICWIGERSADATSEIPLDCAVAAVGQSPAC